MRTRHEVGHSNSIAYGHGRESKLLFRIEFFYSSKSFYLQEWAFPFSLLASSHIIFNTAWSRHCNSQSELYPSTKFFFNLDSAELKWSKAGSEVSYLSCSLTFMRWVSMSLFTSLFFHRSCSTLRQVAENLCWGCPQFFVDSRFVAALFSTHSLLFELYSTLFHFYFINVVAGSLVLTSDLLF